MDPSHFIAAQTLTHRKRSPDAFYDLHGHDWFFWRKALRQVSGIRFHMFRTVRTPRFAATHPAE